MNKKAKLHTPDFLCQRCGVFKDHSNNGPRYCKKCEKMLETINREFAKHVIASTDAAIWGIGDTRKEAISDACDNIDVKYIIETCLISGFRLYHARASSTLIKKVEQYGGNIKFQTTTVEGIKIVYLEEEDEE